MKTINTAFLSLILFTTLFSTAHADYEMIDIGSINDSDFVIPVAINESGAIAGRYRVAHSPLLMEEAVRKGKTNYRGFIWQNGNFADVGPDPDPKRPQNLTRISLNDKGDVACTIGNMPYVWAQGKLSRLEMVQDKYTGGIVWDLTNTGKVICAFYNDSNNMDLFIVETQILVTKDTGQPSQEEKTDSFLQIGTIDQSPDKIKDIVLTESGRILVITHYMPRTLRSDINPDSDYEPYTSYVYTDGVLHKRVRPDCRYMLRKGYRYGGYRHSAQKCGIHTRRKHHTQPRTGTHGECNCDLHKQKRHSWGLSYR